MTIAPVDVFFNTDVFATSATYTTAGTTTAVSVIFDEAFAQVQMGDDEYESTKPIAQVKTTDFPNVVDGDTLTINSTVYYIIQKEYDVQGVTRLILSLDPP